MAGYLNTVQQWDLFSVAWSEELQAAPRIEYLKMVEATHLRGQFRGWSREQRDEKLRGLARVVRHFKPLSFEFSVSRSEYYDLVTPVAPRGLGMPHFPCVFGVMSGLARFVHCQGAKVLIDFIFDDQTGVCDDINLFFSYMKRNIPSGPRGIINGNPIFRDDREFLPLQAADMLVWHIRREHESAAPVPMADLLRSEHGHLVSRLEADTLRVWSERFAQLPTVEKLKSKGQWQSVKREISRLQSLGYVPPHGSHWKNTLQDVRARLARLFR